MKVSTIIFHIIILGGVILSSGCSKKDKTVDLKYTPEEFTHILGTTSAADDKDSANAINFADYAPGVVRAHSKPMIYERLSFAIIEFETEKQARDEAMRLNQYYSRNVLFDKVDGEPVLEDLVIVKFHAVNPKKAVQRKPKNIPAAANPDHGAPAASGH